MLTVILERVFGVRIDIISPEEAARIMLEKEVTFKWQPQIVELTPAKGRSAPGALSAMEPGT